MVEGLKNLHKDKLKQSDIDVVMSQLDSNKNGFIDYTEFIAGCLHTATMLNS